MTALVRSGFLAFMLSLAVVGSWVAQSGLPEYLLVGVALVAVAAAFAAERIAPYRPDWNHDRGDLRRDIAHALVNEGAVIATVALLPAISAHLVAVNLWPDGWPFALQVVIAVLGADLGITLMHALSHRVGWLWRLHSIHHSVKRFYELNGLMKHPLHQTVELTAGVAPLVLIGLPPSVAAALAICVVVQLLVQHANVDYLTGPVGTWLALNSAHRFHHVRDPEEGDVNFGLFTSIWDRWLLGTFRNEPSRVFSSEDIGVSGRPDFPVGYLDQLADPFQSRRHA